ncbi:cupin domain-containing protein [Myceligenerans indicum]|uniref:Cupin domain-containing protein n=1 Tax=Myceligenerans indicum TaxID=2593663 RepID=A0ABS1LPR1_9MICO|nr:cupin domain-containing protein [Myceligenerans indicum]MBL0888256.1 cupin domain-containing protein [Myceligenerans indicum]
MADAPVFPGGTSVSHLRVYDWSAPDAPGGSGTPHFHTTSTEAYVVLGGRGRVETLGPDGYATHDLAPGRIVWFSPGVIHRAVNDGDLEVLVVMSNAGLPEAGDAVMTFPPQVLATPDAYRAAAGLPEPSGAGAGGMADDLAEDAPVAAAARARRDLALEGYVALRDAVSSNGPEALEPLYAAAARLVGDRARQWRRLWTTTVARAASDTDRALDALAGTGLDAPRPEDGEQAGTGAVGHLMRGAVAVADARPGPRRYGMCGRLRVWTTR